LEFAELTADDLVALETDRGFLPAVLKTYHPDEQLSGTAADLPILQRVLEGGAYTKDPDTELIALGTCFGDIIAQELGMHWVRFTDEEGVDLALRLRESSVTVFPRSIILKRLERGETPPDLAYLLERIREEVLRMRDECV
jgi:hypothetical protein